MMAPDRGTAVPELYIHTYKYVFNFDETDKLESLMKGDLIKKDYFI